MSVTTAATLRPGRVLAMLGLLAAALLASARPAPAQYPGSIPGVGDELAMDCIAEMESQRDATVTEIERVRDRALELMAEIEADGGSLSDVAHIFKAGRYQIGNEARQTHLNLNRLIADCMYWMRKTNASRSLQLEVHATRSESLRDLRDAYREAQIVIRDAYFEARDRYRQLRLERLEQIRAERAERLAQRRAEREARRAARRAAIEARRAEREARRRGR